MGSVADYISAGDNDPEWYHQNYYIHYMYCDQCGSFQIQEWVEPENHRVLFRRAERFEKLATYAFLSAVVVAIAVVLVKFPGPILSGLLLFAGPLLGLGLVMMIMANRVEAAIHYRGVCCGDCLATYEYGDAFFQRLEDNPQNYSMADVPLSRCDVYSIRRDA